MLAMPYLLRGVDREIRRRAEEMICAHYADLDVTVKSAQRIEQQGILLRGISISEPKAAGPQAQLLLLEEVLLRCDAQLPDMLVEPPQIREIILRRPVVRVTRRRDGSWSIAKLAPLPSFGKQGAKITIEQGIIEIFDPLANPSSTYTCRELNLTIDVPQSGNPSGNSASGNPVSAGAVSDAPTAVAKPRRHIRGTMLGDHLRRVEFEGHCATDLTDWELNGKAVGLELSPEIVTAIPADWRKAAEALPSIRAQAELQFHVEHHKDDAVPYRFNVTGDLVRGRIEDPRLPYPLQDLRAHLICTNEGLVVENMTASNGPTQLNLAARRVGYGKDAPLYVEASCSRLIFDESLRDILPEKWSTGWQKFMPAGEVDARLKLTYDQQGWQPDLWVGCRNVSFSYYMFPYRLQRGRGTLHLKQDVVDINLTADAGSETVQLAGEVHHPGVDFWGWVTVRADHVPLDSTLFDAMAEPTRAQIRAFHPQGAFSTHLHLWRERGSEDLRRHFQFDLRGCTVRYDRFPYPLENVRGHVELRDDDWIFTGLSGTNDTGYITCEGQIDASSGAEKTLLLDFQGKNIHLEEELRDALKPSLQQVWYDLKPRGRVDLTARVRQVVGQEDMDVSLTLVPDPEATSIEPSEFPYRLERVRGQISFENERVLLKQFSAEHGPVRISTRGDCWFRHDGARQLTFHNLRVSRLEPDRDFYRALPPRLKSLFRRLNPQGPFDLHGSMVFSRAHSHALEEVAWDLDVVMQNNAIDCGVAVRGLNGGIHLAGRFDGKTSFSRGDLDLDSLLWRDYQLTEVRGPFWVDEGRALFGTLTPPVDPKQAPRRMTGKLYGGTLVGDGWIELQPTSRWGMRASVVDADLSRISREVVPGRQDLRGRVLAGLDLSGTSEGNHTLRGQGYIRLHEADVYELPQMVSLLKLLSVRPPDSKAFDQGDIDFRINGEHLYFDRLLFHGDAISLAGTGQMDFNSYMNLNFYAMVGRHDHQLPILREVMGAASQQFLEIRVDGPLSTPDIRREAFPAVNRVVQQWLLELPNPALLGTSAANPAESNRPATPPSTEKRSLREAVKGVFDPLHVW